jgi:hypothetical protein
MRFRLKPFIFLFSLATILGNAYNTFIDYDYTTSPDCRDYVKMAKGIPAPSPIRRYRVIVPNLAQLVNVSMKKAFSVIWPYKQVDKSLILSFLIVNSLIMALFGLFLFQTARAYGAGILPSLIGLTAVLTSRWAGYIAGAPMTDSLYLLVIALTMYGVKTKNLYAILFAIFVGPFAKESFIFIAPIIFFFAPEKKYKLLIYFALSGAMVFSFRYFADQYLGQVEFSQSLNSMANTIDNILVSINKILTFKGLGELFSVVGLFTFIILAGFFGGNKQIISWMLRMDQPCIWLIVAIIIHALLSKEVGRMFYHLTPVLMVGIALILEYHKYFHFLKPNGIKKDQP